MKFPGHAIERFFGMLALVLFKHRIKTLVLVLLGFIALVSHLGHLTADVTTEGFLHKRDSSLKAYNRFKHQFGNDDLIIIGIKSDAIFCTKTAEEGSDFYPSDIPLPPLEGPEYGLGEKIEHNDRVFFSISKDFS